MCRLNNRAAILKLNKPADQAGRDCDMDTDGQTGFIFGLQQAGIAELIEQNRRHTRLTVERDGFRLIGIHLERTVHPFCAVKGRKGNRFLSADDAGDFIQTVIGEIPIMFGIENDITAPLVEKDGSRNTAIAAGVFSILHGAAKQAVNVGELDGVRFCDGG